MARDYSNATCGIYKITCNGSGNIYIGSSKHIDSRLSSHKNLLKAGTHHSKYMQRSWDKYGEDTFQFDIVIECEEFDLLFHEASLIDELRPAFNSAPVLWDDESSGYRQELINRYKEHCRRNRPQYSWKGLELSLVEIAEMEEVDHSLLISRVLGSGMTIEEAVTKPKKVVQWVVEYNGETKSIDEWAKDLGCHSKRIQSRLVKGQSFDEIYDEIAKSNKRMSFSEFCKLGGVNIKTATSRRNNGRSLMECLL